MIPHADRGSQYTSAAYPARLRHDGLQVRVSRGGNCYDNACIESWHSLLKKQLLYQHRWRTRDEATSAMFSYIEIFDNRQRVHSALGYRTPAAYLAAGGRPPAAGLRTTPAGRPLAGQGRRSCLTVALTGPVPLNCSQKKFWRYQDLGAKSVSKACPPCVQRHKPYEDVCHCPACGFRIHRNGVGAVNIRRKSLGL
ncbi:MAG: integrase core domain-containing protein [Firmicutes bacterium]|nr:integrase core domain-containing protein [Bacillota bacterium]